MMSEMAGGAAARSILYAKELLKVKLWVFTTNSDRCSSINNPGLNYSIYLSNTLIPGITMLMILMVTVFSIGVEIKEKSAEEWLRVGKQSIHISLLGKLLPHTLIFMIIGLFYNYYLYGYLQFPCENGCQRCY